MVLKTEEIFRAVTVILKYYSTNLNFPERTKYQTSSDGFVLLHNK